MQLPGFCGPSFQSRSTSVDAETLINWYVHIVGMQSATAKTALWPTPGLNPLAVAPTQPGRGLYAYADKLFSVYGNTLYDVSKDFVFTARGTMVDDGTPCTLAGNGDGGGEVMVTSGNNAYMLNLDTNALTLARANSFMGGMIDGFFLVLDITTSTLAISAHLDGTTWDGTQIFQRDISPDPWKAMKVASGKAWMFGQELTDVFYNAGTSPFPFAPTPGGGLPYGIEAPYSAAEYNGQMMWLGRSQFGARVVVRASSYTSADIISDAALNYALSTYTTVDDGEAFIYQELGTTFYCLTLPTQNVTWCYHDGGGWHQRAYWNPAVAQYGFWRPRSYAQAFGKHLVQDRTSGTLFEMSSAFPFDADGAYIVRERIAPTLVQEQIPFIIDNFVLYAQPGLGLVSGQGSDPLVELSYSKDSGRTFGPTRRRSAGKMGEFLMRMEWNRLGQFRQFTPRIRVSDPIPWLIYGASVNVPRGAQ
jgi:hypothetical protein